jgi:hypothetical protein
MKRLFLILITSCALLSASAFAANKGSFYLAEPATLNGKQLAEGQYGVQWDGSGPDVEVKILSHGKVVTTVPARLIELSRKGVNDATEWNKNNDGTQSLVGIDFAGKKYALDFRTTTATTDPATPAGQSQ